ncbi:flagellar hook-associated protein FlgK [Aromatoleum bremense]|uniref:Flagellar hook-associated protein 1 n=1 Tax=Aromatoleum bremense TaxID=76115 RepID=A0ABX1NZE0_9RHOO|nr:flagellar hook-associated protein FlgK [Aromatoleum bremense]NMG17424.1 flagellar hook-associated protein FlgK [Aromatoleum bremense]QTQ30881.1 Flagellar hook-associated protein I [Aromatoleum bremense]
MAGLLSIGLTGINSSQANLLTTSHNITNANTPGYHRQTAIITTNDPQFSGAGFFGQGSRVDAVRRQYDQFLGQQVLSASARKEELSAYDAQLGQLDNLLADPSAGLAPALSDFFKGVQDVATNPASIPGRQALISKAESLASRFNGLDARLDEISSLTEGQIASAVESIDTYARQIAEMNQQIGTVQVAGPSVQANDLLDQRDTLVAELNKLVKVSTVTERDGSLSVFVGSGQALVVGATASELAVKPDPSDPLHGTIELRTAGGGAVPLPDSLFTGGQLGGLLKFRSEVLDTTRGQLDQIAFDFATRFNEQHRSGLALNGQLGGDFFSIGTTAAGAAAGIRIAVSDPQAVAAAADASDPGPVGPSDNRNALALAALQTDKSVVAVGSGKAAIGSAYSQLVSSVGNKAREVQIGLKAQEAQLDQATAAQEALSGVNLDEEAANLIRYQQSYQAAARVMSVAGTLFDEILSIAR